MQKFGMVAGVGVLLMIVAAFLPWISISVPFLGSYQVSLADIFSAWYKVASALSSYNIPSNILSNLQSSGPGLLLLLSLLMFGVGMLAGIAGTGNQGANKVAGGASILSVILWYIGFETIKSGFVAAAGIFGSAIAGAFSVGNGLFAAMIAGVIFLVASTLK